MYLCGSWPGWWLERNILWRHEVKGLHVRGCVVPCSVGPSEVAGIVWLFVCCVLCVCAANGPQRTDIPAQWSSEEMLSTNALCITHCSLKTDPGPTFTRVIYNMWCFTDCRPEERGRVVLMWFWCCSGLVLCARLLSNCYWVLSIIMQPVLFFIIWTHRCRPCCFSQISVF